MGDILLLTRNVLLNRTQYIRLHSLSYGWLHPSDVWLLPGIFASKTLGEPVAESPQCLEEVGGHNLCL